MLHVTRNHARLTYHALLINQERSLTNLGFRLLVDETGPLN
jgi:hypothetical protein